MREKLKNKLKWDPIHIGIGHKAANLAIKTTNPNEAIELIETLKKCANKVGLQMSFEKAVFFATKTDIKN